MFVVQPPSEATEPFVDQVWYYESSFAHAYEFVLPSAKMQLLIGLSDAWPRVVWIGPSTRPSLVPTAAMSRLVGVSFRAGGARPFFPIPANEFVDEEVEVSEVWSGAGDLRGQLLETGEPTVMLRRIQSLLSAHLANLDSTALVAAATSALDHGTSVAALVDRIGTSRTTFVRRFRDHVGVTPKRYASLARFQRAVRGLAGGHHDFVRLAVECGYYDQAHFTHDFKRFAHRTPSAYRPRDAGEPNHVLP